MGIPRDVRRWIALAGLGTVAAGCFWLLSVQAFLALLTPFGRWQWPAIAHVVVLRIDRDPEDHFLDDVVVLQDGRRRVLRMLKTERAALAVDDDIWILDNYYAFGSRPPQYRLTPQRLLLEYPEPLLLLALWGIARIRRAQARDLRAAQEDSRRVRTVFRDDFHTRALRRALQASPDPGEDPAEGERPLTPR